MDRLMLILWSSIRFVFFCAVVWILVAAIRGAMRGLATGKRTIVLVVAILALFGFVRLFFPLALIGAVADWYDHAREVPPDGFPWGIWTLSLPLALVVTATAIAWPARRSKGGVKRGSSGDCLDRLPYWETPAGLPRR